MEDWVTIRQLKAKNPEMSLREIGKLMGVDHHTVKSAIEKESLPEYRMDSRINPRLKPFEEVIFEMANVKGFRGSRIYEEICSKGYTGGKTAFYEHLKRVKLESQKYFTPYETLPGIQSQFDWSSYTVLIGGVLTETVFFSYINSFSRYQIFEESFSADQGSVFGAMEGSMTESGGVPVNIQTDNAKVFVLNASKNNFQWNPRYLHFCGHYGFEPKRSLPGHPWSKGKVEKPFQYLEDHFIAGNSFEDFEDLHRKLKEFQQRVNQRVHSTIKTTPEALIKKDREAFSPLPDKGYVGVKEEIRKVTFDCLFSFNGSRYSAPWMFAGKQIWVRVSKGYYLEIYSQANKLVARHKLAPSKGSIVIEKSHYRGNNNTTGNFKRLQEEFLKEFQGNELFLEKLLAQKRLNANRHLFQFLELAKLYHKDDMIQVIKVCLAYNVFNASFITGYLEKNFRQLFVLQKEPLHYHLTSEPLTRDLHQYQITFNTQNEGTIKNGTDTD